MKKVAYALVVCLVVGCALFQADAFAKHQAKAVKKEHMQKAANQFARKFDYSRVLQNKNLVNGLVGAVKALVEDHKSSGRRLSVEQEESMNWITYHMWLNGLEPLHLDTCQACLNAGDNCWVGYCTTSSDCTTKTDADLVWGTYGPSGSTTTRNCTADVSYDEIFYSFYGNDGTAHADFETLSDSEVTFGNPSAAGNSRGTAYTITEIKGTAINGANIDHAVITGMSFSISGDRLSFMKVMKGWMVGVLGKNVLSNPGFTEADLNTLFWSQSTAAVEAVLCVFFTDGSGNIADVDGNTYRYNSSGISDPTGEIDCIETLSAMDALSLEPEPGHYFAQILEFALNAAISVEGVMYGALGDSCLGWEAGYVGIGHVDLASQTDYIGYYGNVTNVTGEDPVTDWEQLLAGRTEQAGAYVALCIDAYATGTDTSVTDLTAVGLSAFSGVALHGINYWQQSGGEQYVLTMCTAGGVDCVDIFVTTVEATFNGNTVEAGESKVAFRGGFSGGTTDNMYTRMWTVGQVVAYDVTGTGAMVAGGVDLDYEAQADVTTSTNPFTTSDDVAADSASASIIAVASNAVTAANCGTLGGVTGTEMAQAIEAAIIAEEEFLDENTVVDVSQCTVFTFDFRQNGAITVRKVLWDPTTKVDVAKAKEKLTEDGFSTEQAVITETVTDCIAPTSTTGYTNVVETSLSYGTSFAVSAACATGYTGTATATACSAPGQAYVLGGCSVDATASGAIRAIARSTLSSFVLLLISFVLLN